MAIERLTAGIDTGEIVSPGRAKGNFFQRLDALIPLVRDTMEKAQARYKRAVDNRVPVRREALRVGDWVIVKSHENQGGKLVFKALGPYQILKTDGRRITIKSDEGIRTINGTHATRAPEPPEGDPAWARALAAWQVPSLPTSASKPIEAVFDHFVGQGYDEHERLMLKVLLIPQFCPHRPGTVRFLLEMEAPDWPRGLRRAPFRPDVYTVCPYGLQS